MKHLNIASVLGWQDAEDIDEGLFLQPAEAAAIDAALANIPALESGIATTQEMIDQLTRSNEERERLLEEARLSLEEANAELASIKGGSSGKGTSLATDANLEINAEESSTLPRYDSPEHPANIAASRINRFKK